MARILGQLQRITYDFALKLDSEGRALRMCFHSDLIGEGSKGDFFCCHPQFLRVFGNAKRLSIFSPANRAIIELAKKSRNGVMS